MSGLDDLTGMKGGQLEQVATGAPAQQPTTEPAAAVPPPAASPSFEDAQKALNISQGTPAQPAQTDASAPAELPSSPFDVASKPELMNLPAQTPAGIPQAQPTPPQAQQAPVTVQPPEPLTLTPEKAATVSADSRKALADLYFKNNANQSLNPLEQFLLGGHHGAVTVGAEGKSLVDYMTGHVSKASEDWQTQAEQGIPQSERESLGYKAGDMAGQMGAYGATAAGVAAAGIVEIPAGAAAAVGLGAMALEGAALGTTGAIHDAARKGKEADPMDIAGGAAASAVLSPLGYLGIRGLGKGLGAVSKGIAKGVMDHIHKLNDAAQSELLKAEAASLQAANQALAAGTAPVTALAKKQVEFGAQLRAEIDADIQRLASGGKKQRLYKPSTPEAEAEQGPVRGVRKGLGYQRAYDATPLPRILSRLPEAIAKPFAAAVDELAEAKLALEHLKKEVATYAENAIRLAREPAEIGRITKEIEAHGKLHSGANDSLSKVRAYLFGEMRKLEAMTHPLANLEISTTKHVHVDADATQLATVPRKLPAKTFVAAAKQAEDAKRELVNAEAHLAGLRDKHQGLFEQVDTHLGQPTRVRVIRGHAKFGPSETVVSVGQQFDPSRAQLTGRWLDRYNQIKRGIEAVERNWKEKITYNVAHKGRVTPQGAAKLLRDAGLIHPVTKGILLAGSLGINAMQGPPADAAGLDDSNTPQQNIAAYAALPAAMVGVILARKYGPAGARRIARSSRFIFHFLYEDTQGLAGMADQMIANFRSGGPIHQLDSLANAMQEYRGKLMQGHFLPDAHNLIARALIGEAEPQELAMMSPQGHQFVREVEQLRAGIASFAGGYTREFDDGYRLLAAEDQTGASEIRHAVHMVNDVFNGGSKTTGGGDLLLQKGFARMAAFQFTLNWKIAATAWLHDMAAYGGMQLGVPSVYAAYAQYTASPILRGLVGHMHLGGAATEAAQQINSKAPVYSVEAIHNQLAFLGSLNRQFQALDPAQVQHLGVTSANDFAEKVMTMGLPDDHLARIFEEAALDVSRATGADVAHLNKLGTERAFVFGNITKYTRYIMLDQRLVKTNLQAAAQYFSEGKTALGMQRVGRLAHALGVKAQYGGAKALIPVTAYAALMSNPYTAGVMADVAKKIDDVSLGLTVFGDLGEHGRWDPVIAPVMGQRLPGFDDGIEAFKQVASLGADTAKMQQVLASGDPAALVTGSKENEDVKKGQRALVGMLNLVGFAVPKIRGIPTRFIRDAVKAAPDVFNKEFEIGVPSPWPIGEKTKPAAPAKLFGYAAFPDQTQEQADAEAGIDAFGELFNRKPGRRQRAYAQATYPINAAKKAFGADAPYDGPEPAEVGGLSEK